VYQRRTSAAWAMLNLHRRDWTDSAKMAFIWEFLDCSLIPSMKIRPGFHAKR
jgi:hypothetical protein